MARSFVILFKSFLAYYVSIAIQTLFGDPSLGAKAHATKIVERDEMGKIVSFMSLMDTLAPVLTSTLFAYIFSYTIDTYPGATYQITATLILLPLIGMMWIDLYTERPVVNKLPVDSDEIQKQNSINNNNKFDNNESYRQIEESKL